MAESLRRTLAALVATTLLFSTSNAAHAAVPQGNDWPSIAHLPDWWVGAWQATEFRRHFIEPGVVPWNDLDIPFNPKAAAQFNELKRISIGHGDIPTRSEHCISLGVPGDMNSLQTRFQFIFTPGQVTLAGTEMLRRIYTDGRAHLTEIETFQGHSTGHWEAGGILVVDTVSLDPGNEFILGFKQGANSHVVERFHLKNRGLLLDDVTLYAPEVLTKPWTYRLTFERVKGPVLEIDCAQGGGRDLDKGTGN